MPEFKKSSGFKMKGYSYPGESPLKGKKRQVRQQAAADMAASAQEQIAAFGQMKIGAKSPMNQKEEFIGPQQFDMLESMKEMKEWKKHKRIEGLKAAGTKIIGKAGEQLAMSLVARGVDAILTPKKKKVVQKAPDQSGFGKIKFGRA